MKKDSHVEYIEPRVLAGRRKFIIVTDEESRFWFLLAPYQSRG